MKRFAFGASKTETVGVVVGMLLSSFPNSFCSLAKAPALAISSADFITVRTTCRIAAGLGDVVEVVIGDVVVAVVVVV